MRFSDENYRKAFPREDKPVESKRVISDPEPEDVLEEAKKQPETEKQPEPDPQPIQPKDLADQGGDE